MAPPEPRPPEPSRDPAPPLRAFLEQAVPILAAERGINAPCRVKLAALAKDLGLSEDQFEGALRQLQSSPPSSRRPPREQRRLAALHRWLRKEFSQLPHGILSAAQETRLIQFATGQLKLAEQDVREVMRQAASEQGVQRIASAEAHRHVAELVERKVGDASAVDQETIGNLLAVGRGWGLDDEQVKGLIRERTRENRRRRAREQTVSFLVLAAAIVVLVSLPILLAWLVLWDGAGLTRPRETTPPAASSGQRVARSPTSPQPAWWDTDLVLAMAAGRVRWASFEQVYQRLKSSHPSARAAGYEQLVGFLRGDADDEEARDLLREIAVGCVALESDEAAAGQLEDAVLEQLAIADRPLPDGQLDYACASWAVQVAVESLGRSGSASSRQDALARMLGETLGVVVDRGLAPAQLERRCRQALAKQCYEQLIGAAPQHREAVQRLHAALSEGLAKSLNMADVERLDTQLLTAILTAAGENWRSHTPLIERCIASKDPQNVLQILTLYERSKSPALQGYLASLLMLRTGAAPKSASPDDVASAVRRALGVESGPADGDRWAALATDARRALSGVGGDRQSVLENTTALAYYSVMAAALAQKEPGFVVFDQLRRRGPPRWTQAAPRAGGTSRPSPESHRSAAVLTKTQQEALARFSRYLMNYRKYSPPQRLSYLRWLALLAQRGGEVDPRQGAGIADYLTAEKTGQEQQRMLESVAAVTRWKYVRLALADRLADPSLAREATQSLLLAALPFRREPAIGEDWRETWRRRLIEDVLDDLAESEATRGDSQQPDAAAYDQTAQILEELYRKRGRLLGVAPVDEDEASSTAEALRLSLSYVASQLDLADAGPEDQQLVSDLPHRLRAIDYLARSDLDRTALLQQLWIPVLALDVARRRPNRASRAAELAESFPGRQAGAADLFAQLRDAEATSLELWLLCGP